MRPIDISVLFASTVNDADIEKLKKFRAYHANEEQKLHIEKKNIPNLNIPNEYRGEYAKILKENIKYHNKLSRATTIVIEFFMGTGRFAEYAENAFPEEMLFEILVAVNQIEK